MQAGKRNRVRLIVIAAAIITAAAAAVGTTVAYLRMQTDPLENTLEPVYVSCRVNETFDTVTKSNVTVTNTGGIDAYIRAAIVVNWVDESGNVHKTAPVEGKDYDVTFNTEAWIVGDDGLCYYPTAVAPNGETAVLISRLAEKADAASPDGFTLQVQVMASAIQAEPVKAVESAWGVTVDDGGRLTVAAVTDIQ